MVAVLVAVVVVVLVVVGLVVVMPNSRGAVFHKICFKLLPLGRKSGVNNPVCRELFSSAEASDLVVPRGMRAAGATRAGRDPVKQPHYPSVSSHASHFACKTPLSLEHLCSPKLGSSSFLVSCHT